MKEMFAVVAGVFLLASSLATAVAAPVSSAKGIQNSRKVMNHYKERYLNVEKVKKRARAQKQAQRAMKSALPSGK